MGVIMSKYGSDFKIKGKTLIAYTGSSQLMIVPEGIERISKEFESKVQLQGIFLPKSLLCIEEKAFYKGNLCNVNVVKMHDSLEIIRTNAFFHPFEYLEIKNSYGNALYVLEELQGYSYSTMKNLKKIKVTGTKLSEKEKLRIKELLPDCKIINDNYIEVEDGKKIEGLSELCDFNIPSTVEVIG